MLRLRTTLLTCFCLTALVAGTAVPALAQAADTVPFSAERLEQLASDLAKKPFVAPEENVPEPWANIGYDQYRDIRFRQQRAVWHGERRNFELHLLPTGWLYKYPVTVNIVENGFARPLQPDNALFDFGRLVDQPKPDTGPIPFSGFRVNGQINRPNVFDEILVFQGASYFRGVSRGQVYGLSARGLAIDVAQPRGEEFPFFRTFWVEQPAKAARRLVVHALLDSPSATGIYTFRVAGGAPTTVDVTAKLYPRRDLMHVGLAPLTSMFLFSGADRARIGDFRRAVHDSDGLAIATRRERIWRPLSNPRRLQVSAFTVDGLTGFGLVQRARRFSDYEDLEANYERRPSAWIEPVGSWGNGTVRLVEIPSEEEIHDNIVAYWNPVDIYAKDQGPYSFAYRILWPDDAPRSQVSTVRSTLSGPASGAERKAGAIRYAVDFTGPDLAKVELPKAALSTSAGKVSDPVVVRNPSTRGVRVDFMLTPDDADVVELRLELRRRDALVSEVWLSRWTK
jgi:periplasmic glucans biosynthesis protein